MVNGFLRKWRLAVIIAVLVPVVLLLIYTSWMVISAESSSKVPTEDWLLDTLPELEQLRGEFTFCKRDGNVLTFKLKESDFKTPEAQMEELRAMILRYPPHDSREASPGGDGLIDRRRGKVQFSRSDDTVLVELIWPDKGWYWEDE